MFRRDAALFLKFPLRGFESRHAGRPAALGYLPAVRSKRKSILTHKNHVAVVIDRDNANRVVLEMDDAIDPGLARGIQHLVVVHTNPRIVVHGRARRHRPRIFRFVHSFHGASNLEGCGKETIRPLLPGKRVELPVMVE